jgi:D-psicose/D-tagatose/L-ribulose 3-epimerase
MLFLRRERMAGLKLSIHAGGWTPIWSNDYLHLIDHAKELGFDALEIPFVVISTIDAAATKARASAAGIEIVCGCLCTGQADPTGEDEETRNNAREYLRERIRLTAEIGARTMTGVLYSGPWRRVMPTEEHWEQAATALRQAARFARDQGVTLGIEVVNRFEGFLINTAEQAVRLREMIGEPNVGVHLDSFHMNIEEDNLYEATARAAPYLCHFHLCESHRGEVGTGLVNFDDIFRALAEAGYSGTGGLEMFGPFMAPGACMWRGTPGPIDDVVARSLAHLKRLGAKYYGS